MWQTWGPRLRYVFGFSSVFRIFARSYGWWGVILADGVTGNTSDFGSEESRFET